MRSQKSKVKACYPFDLFGRKYRGLITYENQMEDAKIIFNILMEKLPSETYNELLGLIEDWENKPTNSIRRKGKNPSKRSDKL